MPGPPADAVPVAGMRPVTPRRERGVPDHKRNRSLRMDTALFDFELPANLIAQRPAEPRDASRLLVLDRRTGFCRHLRFRQLPGLLRETDLLVHNNTRVSEYQFRARRDTGGRLSVTLLEALDSDCRVWRCLIRGSVPARGGSLSLIGSDGTDIPAVVQDIDDDGTRILNMSHALDAAVLAKYGTVPLPPYIKDFDGDRERYQTVYAREAGSVAAPTAGLHFTGDLLAEIAAATMGVCPVTLQVGRDTFAPVRSDDLTQHTLSGEPVEIPVATAQAVNRCRNVGGRILSVGTTTTRTLEWAAQQGRTEPGAPGLRPVAGLADTYIYPGFRFQAVDCILTNFHLPRSTPLFMISAFIGEVHAEPDRGRTMLLEAYATAIREGYRFYSFGDAMLIV